MRKNPNNVVNHIEPLFRSYNSKMESKEKNNDRSGTADKLILGYKKARNGETKIIEFK